MHTEEKAKELWCPIASHTDPRGKDQFAEEPFKHHCIGSKCSQWRWGVMVVHPDCKPEPEQKRSFWDIFHPPKIPTYGPLPEIVQSDKGYCGLAGQP